MSVQRKQQSHIEPPAHANREIAPNGSTRANTILKTYSVYTDSHTLNYVTIVKGINSQAISDLMELTELNQAEISRILDLTEPTLRKHLKMGKELNTGLSEHILQLFELFEIGIDTFGSLEEFKSWLARPNIGIDAELIQMLLALPGLIS